MHCATGSVCSNPPRPNRVLYVEHEGVRRDSHSESTNIMHTKLATHLWLRSDHVSIVSLIYVLYIVSEVFARVGEASITFCPEDIGQFRTHMFKEKGNENLSR